MIPFPRVLKRRSSWPSSVVPALLGWSGFATVAALGFGRAPRLPSLLGVASACAVIQVLALRARLRAAPRPDGVLAGCVSGALTALFLAPGAMAALAELASHPWVTLRVAVYIGAPVAPFLFDFRRG